MSSELLEAGAIGRPHGIKGELSVLWHAETPPTSGLAILAGPDAMSAQPHKIAAARAHHGKILLALEDVKDRTQAEAMTGLKLFIPKQELEPLEDDEAWLADLADSRVILKDGTEVGTLHHFEFPAGQEIWAIHDRSGNEILFPARPEFIIAINADEKVVTIDPPEGLLEIYRA